MLFTHKEFYYFRNISQKTARKKRKEMIHFARTCLQSPQLPRGILVSTPGSFLVEAGSILEVTISRDFA
jgi:hypothetical protein